MQVFGRVDGALQIDDGSADLRVGRQFTGPLVELVCSQNRSGAAEWIGFPDTPRR
jgi:hypothetical protein